MSITFLKRHISELVPEVDSLANLKRMLSSSNAIFRRVGLQLTGVRVLRIMILKDGLFSFSASFFFYPLPPRDVSCLRAMA